MGFWKDLWTDRSEDWFYHYMPVDQTPGDIESRELEQDEDYVEVWLKSTRIVNVRKGLSKFYGTVHSYISLLDGNGDLAEFNVVTTPGKLAEMDAKNLDRVINMNKKLLGPAAYTGGDLEMEIGLFSIKSADLAQPFISLLEDMSGLAGVSFIATALPYADPIKKGINLLTGGADDTVLEIGLAQTFAKLKTGYYVVMRAPKDSIDAADLKIEADYKLVDKNGKAIKDFPYMVLAIDSTKEKDDWKSIPELKQAYAELKNELRNSEDELAMVDAFKFFKRIVLTSSDLIFDDKQKIIDKVEETVSAVVDTIKGEGSKTVSVIPELEDIDIY